jgi:hypothetical protein
MRRRCLLPVPDHGATLGGAKGGLWDLDEKKRALPQCCSVGHNLLALEYPTGHSKLDRARREAITMASQRTRTHARARCLAF